MRYQIVASDQELVRRAKAGTPGAMEQLLRRHDSKMRGLAWKMLGSADLMDDALQDAYLKAYNAIASFREESAFTSWLHRIVANACIDQARMQARRQELALRDDHQPVIEENHRIIERQQIERALENLPIEQKAALLLIDCEGYSYREVAAILETTTGTIGSWLSRARTTMRDNETLQ